MKIEVRVNFMDKNNIFFPYKNWVKAKKKKLKFCDIVVSPHM